MVAEILEIKKLLYVLLHQSELEITVVGHQTLSD